VIDLRSTEFSGELTARRVFLKSSRRSRNGERAP